jgi:hypothetical protein
MTAFYVLPRSAIKGSINMITFSGSLQSVTSIIPKWSFHLIDRLKNPKPEAHIIRAPFLPALKGHYTPRPFSPVSPPDPADLEPGSRKWTTTLPAIYHLSRGCPYSSSRGIQLPISGLPDLSLEKTTIACSMSPLCLLQCFTLLLRWHTSCT